MDVEKEDGEGGEKKERGGGGEKWEKYWMLTQNWDNCKQLYDPALLKNSVPLHYTFSI